MYTSSHFIAVFLAQNPNTSSIYSAIFKLQFLIGYNMIGALDMFAIGIGPSSSHTIGPMKAALEFVTLLKTKSLLSTVNQVKAHLYGSLALTGEGHGTVLAVLNGLCGEHPKTVDPDSFIPRAMEIKTKKTIDLLNQQQIPFVFAEDIILHKDEFLVLQHANGMRFVALNNNGQVLLEKKYFSVGGGFILDEDEIKNQNSTVGSMVAKDITKIPYPFKSAAELFTLCRQHNLTIAELVIQNELVRKTLSEIRQEALEIIQVMHESVIKGLHIDGILPGGLGVKRRAAGLYKKLYTEGIETSSQNQRLLAMAYAMAVNEENAAFSRIVTAPTNGAAGTIPGVLEYYRNFCDGVTEDKFIEFILTAGTIGMLYKFGASISAAEVGCQGEIGVACSMAAGALTAVLGGTLTQIEKAAEIAMEHSLGMTCDPIAGLVQIPCIERNGVAASKAIDIARLALLEELPGMVSLDDVIKTMLQTGKDMSMKYKETALGGLAVSVVNC
jgi:L-serine dehydratase